jgi:hypothetical protein
VPDPTKQRPGDQPLPTPGRECVQDALIAEIQARKALGEERYGSPLMTHNGRDAIRDAREEAVDLAVYLMQVELEVRDLRTERDFWEQAATRNGELYSACENQRDDARAERDRLATTLGEALSQFVHRTHPGRSCLQSNHVSADQVEAWRSVLATKGAPR